MPESTGRRHIGTTGGSYIEGGDYVSRDQIIQNIVLVGRFLDYAQVEGLIPPTSAPVDVTSISSAFEGTFEKGQGSALAEATATAGALFGDVLADYLPSKPFEAMPYRRVLTEIAPELVDSLEKLGYWDAFYEYVTCSIPEGEGLISVAGQVVWLYSLQELWNRYFESEKLYGLARMSAARERQLFTADSEKAVRRGF